MIIDFNKLNEIEIPNLNNGKNSVLAKMYMDKNIKIMISTLPAGASIGRHHHASSSEINYVLKGKARATCDDKEEYLTENMSQYCQAGSSHSIENVGDEELVMFTVVIEKDMGKNL